MGRHVEWRKVPYSAFDVNRLGDLRKSDTKKEMDQSFMHTFYRGRSTKGDTNEARLTLVNLVFPEFKR